MLNISLMSMKEIHISQIERKTNKDKYDNKPHIHILLIIDRRRWHEKE